MSGLAALLAEDGARIPLFGAILLVATIVQTVTGFGAMLVCVTVGALLMSIPEVVTLVVPLSLMQTTYIAVRHHSGIRWSLLLGRVLPLMGTGLVVGYLGFADAADGVGLRRAFGLMVGILAARELAGLARVDAEAPGSEERGGAAELISGTALLGAGVVHGIYATGGPLLVYALGRERLVKHEFRSTLASVWLVLNVALAATFAAAGRYDREMLTHLAMLAPVAPVGIALGEILHHRVDERRFKIAVFTLLIIVALSLVLR